MFEEGEIRESIPDYLVDSDKVNEEETPEKEMSFEKIHEAKENPEIVEN